MKDLLFGQTAFEQNYYSKILFGNFCDFYLFSPGAIQLPKFKTLGAFCSLFNLFQILAPRKEKDF